MCIGDLRENETSNILPQSKRYMRFAQCGSNRHTVKNRTKLTTSSIFSNTCTRRLRRATEEEIWFIWMMTSLQTAGTRLRNDSFVQCTSRSFPPSDQYSFKDASTERNCCDSSKSGPQGRRSDTGTQNRKARRGWKIEIEGEMERRKYPCGTKEKTDIIMITIPMKIRV